MIRYYFDVVIDNEVTADEEGLLLLDVESARREASLALAEIARDELRSVRTISQLSVLVRTFEGPICEASFQWEPNS
jgi:uncharacterized protein DUF6894